MSQTIAWIVEGGRDNPAARLRAFDVADALRAAGGVACLFAPFSLSAPPAALVLQKVCARPALDLARRLKAAGTRCVFDVCDPIWMQSDINIQRGWDVDQAMALADLVTVPTPTLRQAVAARYPAAHCAVIPDALDLDRPEFSRRPRHVDGGRLRLGWISTSLNLQHLAMIADDLRACAAEYELMLRIISTPHQGMLPALPRVPIEFVPWQIADYHQHLRECDMALLALPLDEWNRGKSANRLQLCMALGVPAVFSPLPAYRDLLADCPELLALAAGGPGDWRARLQTLRDATTRERLADAGRRLVTCKAHLNLSLPLWRQALLGV